MLGIVEGAGKLNAAARKQRCSGASGSSAISLSTFFAFLEPMGFEKCLHDACENFNVQEVDTPLSTPYKTK